MRVLLVQPKVDERVSSLGRLEPLSLEILASAAAGDGHDVRIFDYRFERELRNELESWRPDVIGITALTVEYRDAVRIIKEIRSVPTYARLIVGGVHATLVPEDFNLPGVDAIVLGLGHRTLRELLVAYAENGDIFGISGLALPSPAGLYYTARRLPEETFGEIPSPARDLTEKYRRLYRSTFSLSPEGDGISITSLGCPGRCMFCSSWQQNSGRYLERDAESAVEDILSIKGERVMLADDNSLHNVERAWEMVRLLKRARKRKYIRTYARADTIAANPGLMRALKEAGFHALIVGYEAATDRRLNGYRKGSTLDTNRAAIKVLREAGIQNRAMFVVAPDFGREDFETLFDFIDRERLRTPIFTVLTPVHGTSFYKQQKANLLTDEHAYYDYVHCVLPTSLRYMEFYAEFRRIYSRANSLRRYARDWAFEWREWAATGKRPKTERLNQPLHHAVLTKLIFARKIGRLRQDYEEIDRRISRDRGMDNYNLVHYA